jgi:hypothetical protein
MPVYGRWLYNDYGDHSPGIILERGVDSLSNLVDSLDGFRQLRLTGYESMDV